MLKLPGSIAACLALGAISSGLSAADAAKHPCANVRDDADRLACYDEAFGKPIEAAAAPAAAPEAQFGYTEQQANRADQRIEARHPRLGLAGAR